MGPGFGTLEKTGSLPFSLNDVFKNMYIFSTMSWVIVAQCACFYTNIRTIWSFQAVLMPYESLLCWDTSFHVTEKRIHSQTWRWCCHIGDAHNVWCRSEERQISSMMRPNDCSFIISPLKHRLAQKHVNSKCSFSHLFLSLTNYPHILPAFVLFL